MSEVGIQKFVGSDVPDRDPTVSVIIPAYNVADFITETLDSVFEQDFKDFEVLLVNDGSPDTDELEARIESYRTRLIYLRQANSGAAAARNTAIENARGKYVAFLDGDDVWLSGFLTSQIDFLNEGGFDLVYADAWLFGENIGQENFMRNAPSDGELTLQALIKGECNILTSTTIARRELVVSAGGFDTARHLAGMEDFDLWTRLLKAGATGNYQKKILARYRVRAGSLSGSNVARAERTVTALTNLAAKLSLTHDETDALETRLKFARKCVSLEKAKTNLVHGNYTEALRDLRSAQNSGSSVKLDAVVKALSMAPALVRVFYRLFRPAEFLLILNETQRR